MRSRWLVLGLILAVCALPIGAQRPMREARTGATTSSGASDRAEASRDSKNNPELSALAKQIGGSVASLRKEYEASKNAIPSLNLSQYAELKLAAKEFRLDYADLLQARRDSPSLSVAITKVEPKVDSATLPQRLKKVDALVQSLKSPY
jgi:hypothetical protein